MPLQNRIKHVGVALEDNKGTAETLVGGDFNVLAFEPVFNPQIESEDRMPAGLTMGSLANNLGAYEGRARLQVEIRGSGAAGTAPVWGRLLQACGMAVANVESTSDTYTPISSFDDQKCATLALVENGRRKTITGAMGNVVINGARNGRKVMAEFDFRGVWNAPTDADIPTGISQETTKPIRFAGGVFTRAAASQYVSNFRFDLGNDIQLRPDVEHASGLAHAFLANRNPRITFDPEAQLVADDDIFGTFLATTTQALAVTFGATAGNRCVIAVPRLQILSPESQDRSGQLVDRIECLPVAANGDDEFSIAFT